MGADPPRPVGLIIPGGESTTIDKLMRRFGLVEPVRALITGGAPVLGTCAGMIMLADTVVDGTPDQQTLGGIDLVVRRNAFGRQVDSFEVELDVGGLDAPYRAVFIRAPWVDRVGPSVEVLAIREVDGADHPVAVRSDALTAVSFHPELTGDPRVHALAFASLLTPTAAGATASRQLISNGETFAVDRAVGRHVRLSFTPASATLRRAAALVAPVLRS